jgi:CBS domain-containing protein
MAQLVRDFMIPHPIALPATSSLVEAALTMRDFDVDILLVLDNGQVCGVVTDHDIVVRGIANGNYPATMTLGEICHRQLAMLAPTDRVEDAAALMREKAIRYLPVVEDGQPVGIVSLSDLIGEGHSHATLGGVRAAPQKW